MWPYIIIAIAILLILIFVFKLSKTPNANNLLDDYVSKSLPDCTLLKITNKCFDYEVVTPTKNYLIKMIDVPVFSEVQINNKTTWEIKFGAGSTPGKVQPYKKYLKNIEAFMNLPTTSNQVKIAIIKPSPKKIVKYINESEMIFVTPDIDVYGITVLTIDQLTYITK